MKKFKAYLFYWVVFSIFFASCKFWNEPVRGYFEYWTTTCQVGKIEYLSPSTELDGKPNLSVLTPVELNIYLINPKGYEVLCKPDGTPCFSLKDENGSSAFYSEYSETVLDNNTTIKIQVTLPDATEGHTITLSGCIWPDNRSSLGFTEEQLAESFPELFYTTTFVQNTPPDNVKNMNSSGEGVFFEGTRKHYLSFDLPDLSFKRNHGSRYEVKTYLRESDGELYYTGSEIISVDPSDAGNHTYLYYYPGQEDYLFYEYTVQVLGPHGLKSDMLCTDERLGVHQLTESTVTINGLNGLYDEDNYECIEVESDDDPVSFEAAAAHEGDILTVTVDGIEVPEGYFTVSGIGQHTIVSTSSRDGSRPISVTRKIRIVRTPEPATFDFGDAYFNGFTDTNGFEYIEVEHSDSTTGYSITPTEDDTTVSGTVDGIQFSGEKNAALGVGSHTLVAVIHKQYCQDVSLTRRIMIAKQLEEPVYSFTTYGLSGNSMSGFEVIEVPGTDSIETYTIRPSDADGTAYITGTVSGNNINQTFSDVAQNSDTLPTGEYTINVTVTKEFMTPRPFEKKIKVLQSLQAPSFSFNPDLTQASGGRFIEVEGNSDSISYTVTAESGCTLVVTDSFDNQEHTSSGNSYNGTMCGLGEHRLSVTVRKTNYVDRPFTKTVTVVQKLQEPTYSFNPDFTQESNRQWIEVENDDSEITCTITAAQQCTLEVTDSFNNTSGTSTTNTCNFTVKGIGEHILHVTVKRTNYVDRTFTKTVTVVQKLQAPSYSFDPGLTQESNKQWIEVDGDNSQINCTITVESGCTFEVKDSYDNASSTSSVNYKTIQLKGLGEHTLTVTVKRTNYIDRTFTKTVRVVQKLQKPTFSFSPDFTSESNRQWIEVDDNNTAITCTITAASGCTFSVKDSFNNQTATSNGNTCSFTFKGIGTHKLTVTVKKANYVDRVFEMTATVVQKLQRPSFSFNPDFTSESNNKNIEVDDNNSQITCTITAASGCTFNVKDSFNNQTAASTGNTCSFTFKGIGTHKLTVTVKKANYVDRVFEMTATVVQKLKEPTLTIYKDSLRTTTVNSSTDYEGDASYSSYTNYNVNLDANGNAALYFTFTLPDSATIKVMDKTADNLTSTTNGGAGSFTKLGPHDVTIEVTKSGYVKRTFNKKIYVQGVLSVPEFKANGTKQDDSGDGSTSAKAEKWKFSYLTYAAMEWWIEPGNTGNSVVVKYSGSQIDPSENPLVPNNRFVYSIEQSRDYCKSLQTPKYIDVKINPITVKLGICYLYCDFDDGAAGDEVEIRGKVHLGYNSNYTCLRTFDNNTLGFIPYRWDNFNKDRDPEYTLTSPSDSLNYYSENMYEDDTLTTTDIGNVNKSVMLSFLAEQYRLGKPSNNFDNVKLEVFNSGTAGDTRMGHRIMFNLSE